MTALRALQGLSRGAQRPPVPLLFRIGLCKVFQPIRKPRWFRTYTDVLWTIKVNISNDGRQLAIVDPAKAFLALLPPFLEPV